jgi:tetratricopeptide (TPR) repeat protein/transglutaminase-like putative cysteine protease
MPGLSPFRSRFVVALVCLLLARPAPAADWPVARGPSREPAPFHYNPALWKQVPKAFLDDAPACILYSSATYFVEADGTTENIIHDVTRFNGRKGIDKLGEYRNITYDPSFQKLTLNTARIHKADGRVVEIEPRSVQLRDLATDYQVYDPEKQLIISFPDLEVGDTIEVKWTVRGRHPEYQGQFFTRYNFGDDTYPVVRDELRVMLPRDRTFKYAAVGGKLEPTVRDEGGLRSYTWAVSNRPQLPQDDNLPSKEDLRLEVACSTFASWEEVGRWKQRLRADCWECTAGVRKLVEELTRDLKTPAAKARALTYWVRRNIRYVSLGEKHDYTPHSPAAVVATRYGDCKDQSQLLAVMLREAGVPVALATLGALDDGQVLESLPSPWGTHAIVLATFEGKEHWIDCTVSLAGWDYLPRDDRNRLCYVVDDKGQVRLVRTPPMTADDNRIEQETRVTVAADGSSRDVRTATYFGHAALAQREAWVETPPGERRRLMTAELQDANSRARLLRLDVDSKQLQDFDEPVRASLVFEVPGHFSGDSGLEGSVSDSKVWGKLLSVNLDYDRTVALDLGAPFDSYHHFTVSLPPAYRFDEVPRERELHSRWGSFSLRVRAGNEEPRRVEVDLHTRLEKARIEPAEFEDFRKFHEEVAKYYRAWFTLKAVQDLDDAPLLEAALAAAPDDGASAAVLARLYQHHHMGKEARRVLKRALHYRPNDAALLELTVKLADNLQEEEDAYRDLVRRFPDEPKYAVALGTTLVNRGRWDRAEALLKPLAEKGPAAVRASALYQLARADFRRGRAKEARARLEAADKADADAVSTVEALAFRARVWEKLGKAQEATETYEDLLKLDGNSREALLALVRLNEAAGKRAEALDYLRRYTVAVGSDGEGLATAAEWHLRLGRYEDAFDLASRARETGFHEKAERVLGLVYLHRGAYRDAVLHLTKADPDNEVVAGLLRAHLALGNLSEAAAWTEQAGRLPKPSAGMRQMAATVRTLVERRAALLQGLGVSADRKDAARRAVEACLCAEYAQEAGLPADRVEALLGAAFTGGVELGPAYGLRAVLALDRGRLGKALVDAEQAVALAPEGATGYYVRGRVRLERGNKEALADLEKAATLSGHKDALTLHWLAAALAQAGRSREAVAVQREAVQRRPGDPELAEQLKELEKGSDLSGKASRSGS